VGGGQSLAEVGGRDLAFEQPGGFGGTLNGASPSTSSTRSPESVADFRHLAGSRSSDARNFNL
jgi:hypothetical protein